MSVNRKSKANDEKRGGCLVTRCGSRRTFDFFATFCNIIIIFY
jgi:hypothetical protein